MIFVFYCLTYLWRRIY